MKIKGQTINISNVVKELTKLNHQIPIIPDHLENNPVSTAFQNSKYLIKVLQIPTEKRTKKHIKLIKSVLQSLKAFNYSQREADQLTRQYDQYLVETISYFAGASIARKGQLLGITGKARKNVQVLLSGAVSIFQPSNSTSLKQSVKIFKEKENSQIKSLQNILEQDSQQVSKNINEPQLSSQRIMDLLIQNHIFSKFRSPHRYISTLRVGSLICQSNWYAKLNEQQINTLGSILFLPNTDNMIAVCTMNCLILDIPLTILQNSVEILSKHSTILHEHKPYIASLSKSLRSVQDIPYQFITQCVGKDWIIQRPQKYQIKASEYFYHIVQGQVLIEQYLTPKRNKIENQHKADIKQYSIRRKILTLHNADFFGYENQLFPGRRFIYVVEPNSKILRINYIAFAIQSQFSIGLRLFTQLLRNQRKQIICKNTGQPEHFLKKKQIKEKKKQHGFEKVIKSNKKERQQQIKAYQTFKSLVLHEKKSERRISQPQKKIIINPQQIQQSLSFISRQMLRGSTDIKVQDRQITVFNRKGDLKRKIIIPQKQNQRTTYRRIGLLDIEEVETSNKIAVAHRVKMLGDPVKKGNIHQAFTGQRNLPNFPQLSKKQKNLLGKKSMSLPRIDYLAKKEDRIYKMRFI